MKPETEFSLPHFLQNWGDIGQGVFIGLLAGTFVLNRIEMCLIALLIYEL